MAVPGRATDAAAPRPLRGEARRALIAEAALAVLSRVGPDALTHRLVAAEAGLPVGATTYWYASKEDIVRAAYEHAVERGFARLDALRPTVATWTRDTIAGGLAELVNEGFGIDREAAVVDWVLTIEAARRPELQPAAQALIDAYVAFLADALRAVGGSGSDEDARLVAATLDGLSIHRLASGAPSSLASLTETIDRLLRGIGVLTRRRHG